VELIGAATNKVPAGPYRGAGRPEAAYIVERMVDLVAAELGRDPAAVRRRNLIPPDRFPYRSALGSVYDSGNYAPALARACELVEYDRWRQEQQRARERGRLFGIGLAVYVEPAGGQLWESAAIAVRPDGRVVVRTGSTAHGQGHETTFAQIAADRLWIPLDSVTVEQGDTAALPKGVGTFGSRSVACGGSAVAAEADKIKARMRRIAAHLLEAAEADIRWGPGRLSVQGAPARAVTFQEVAAAAHDGRVPEGMERGLETSGTFRLPGMVYPFGAYAVVVEVERDTGEVRILKFVAVDDAGRIINPLLAEGQVVGAIIQGVGQALVEEAVYDDTGQLVTATFSDYAMLHARAVCHRGVHGDAVALQSARHQGGRRGGHGRRSRGARQRRHRCARPARRPARRPAADPGEALAAVRRGVNPLTTPVSTPGRTSVPSLPRAPRDQRSAPRRRE
jgi:carbon-monoxide dehydrogenase large subunit